MNPSAPMDLRPGLQGKTAFVTGGLGGIGLECVKALLAHGCRVAFTYAQGFETPQRAQSLVESNPTLLSAHPLDLRSLASIRQSLGGAMEHWGRLDILMNVAAVGSATVQAYAEEAMAQDSAMFAINADGALKVCQVFLEAMKDHLNTSSIKIINVSSVGGGVQVFPGFRLSDGMSKAAVAFLTRQLAAELVNTKVDVFAVCPGATNTAMFQASTLSSMTAEEQAAFVDSMPKHRLIEPAEIASIMLFLASSYSSPMHGAVIDASMGLGVRPGMITESKH